MKKKDLEENEKEKEDEGEEDVGEEEEEERKIIHLIYIFLHSLTKIVFERNEAPIVATLFSLK